MTSRGSPAVLGKYHQPLRQWIHQRNQRNQRNTHTHTHTHTQIHTCTYTYTPFVTRCTLINVRNQHFSNFYLSNKIHRLKSTNAITIFFVLFSLVYSVLTFLILFFNYASNKAFKIYIWNIIPPFFSNFLQFRKFENLNFDINKIFPAKKIYVMGSRHHEMYSECQQHIQT